MSPRAGTTGPRTLAFVESPVQLLNVLEWAHVHAHALSPEGAGGPAQAVSARKKGKLFGRVRGQASRRWRRGQNRPQIHREPSGGGLTLVVLSPVDPMTRGQLRRMAELAREEGHEVRWEDARDGTSAPFRTIGGLAPLLRRTRRIVMGDPFSRYVQVLLNITKASDLVVVDDGTATMEFVSQLARGERLVRWHRKSQRPGARDLLFIPVSSKARRRLTPGGRRRVEIFSSMPIEETPKGVEVTYNDFAWTRSRFGPPQISEGADMVGTSLVETGVVDADRYREAVRTLAKAHGVTRYFAHRRESPEKLHDLAALTGLEVVRPDLPLELIARRGPIGRTILSFPSTVVHTLPLALAGTDVKVAVCDIDPAWLTANASPRAQGFLSGVTGSARDVERVSTESDRPTQQTKQAKATG